MFIGEGGEKKLLTIELIARELPYIRFINQIIDKWFFSRRACLEKKEKKKNWKKLYKTRDVLSLAFAYTAFIKSRSFL